MSHSGSEAGRLPGFFTRMRQATGTVYGDIGTSVLYTIVEIVRQLQHHGDYSERALLGGLSLVFWALMFLTVKYDLLVTRADSKGDGTGEGGTFALWTLLRSLPGTAVGLGLIGVLVIVDTGLLAADGLITPVISMLGAFEPLGEAWAVVATVGTLLVLFRFQSRGTARVGGFFGFFMVFLWFPWIALKGIPWAVAHPEVFLAVNPMYAVDFLWHQGWLGSLVILGAVVLAITGGEAMYADMGHFGRAPIVWSWRTFVLPCLLLNYFGQVGYVLDRGVPPGGNTFYALTPAFGIAWLDASLKVFDIGVSTVAAIIASQALITGMFSVFKQAMNLGVCPRMDVRYTSKEHAGQVYIPAVNYAMLVGCVALTLAFQTASNLAAAYGLAVTGAMAITTFCFGYVAVRVWRQPVWAVVLVCGGLLTVEVSFFVANSLKFFQGGYVPILIAAGVVTGMLTWHWGRARLAAAFGAYDAKPIGWLVALREMLDEAKQAVAEELYMAARLVQGPRELVEINRAVVFLCSRAIREPTDRVPVVLRVFLKKTGALPRQITLLHVNQVADPEVVGDRYEVIPISPGIVSVVVSYGYAERPDVRQALRELQQQGRLQIPSDRWIIEAGEEEVLVGDDLGPLDKARLYLFRTILRLATPAHRYFGLGSDAGVSKSVLPVFFDRHGARLRLPELEASVHTPGAG